MKKYIKVFFCAIFSVCLMQPWIYNLVLTSAEGGIKNSPTPATKRRKAQVCATYLSVKYLSAC